MDLIAGLANFGGSRKKTEPKLSNLPQSLTGNKNSFNIFLLIIQAFHHIKTFLGVAGWISPFQKWNGKPQTRVCVSHLEVMEILLKLNT